MRLTHKEVQNLLAVFSRNISNLTYSVYLFGSRADDLKKGGDVDLLLVVPDSDFELARSKKEVLKFDLEEALGDQRIDLTITTPQKMDSDVFLRSVKEDRILLS